ncbi:MAG: hypothetical protein ACP5US_10280 [Candidatus Kryptoniota bacterium]
MRIEEMEKKNLESKTKDPEGYERTKVLVKEILDKYPILKSFGSEKDRQNLLVLMIYTATTYGANVLRDKVYEIFHADIRTDEEMEGLLATLGLGEAEKAHSFFSALQSYINTEERLKEYAVVGKRVRTVKERRVANYTLFDESNLSFYYTTLWDNDVDRIQLDLGYKYKMMITTNNKGASYVNTTNPIIPAGVYNMQQDVMKKLLSNLIQKYKTLNLPITEVINPDERYIVVGSIMTLSDGNYIAKDGGTLKFTAPFPGMPPVAGSVIAIGRVYKKVDDYTLITDVMVSPYLGNFVLPMARSQTPASTVKKEEKNEYDE